MERLIKTLRSVQEKGKKIIITSGTFAYVGKIEDIKFNGYGMKILREDGFDILIPKDDYVEFEKQGGKKFFFVTPTSGRRITTFII